MEDILDDELRQDLMAECSDHLAALNSQLLGLSSGSDGATPSEVYSIFRLLHRVKSGAGYLGNEPLRNVSQCAESVLMLVREGKVSFDDNLIRLLLAAVVSLQKALHEPDSPVDPEVESSLVGRLPASQSAVGEHYDDKPRLRALVVDDELTGRLILQEYLSAFGQCDVASDGQQGLDLFVDSMMTGRPYHLICLDIRMPGADGHEILRQIRRAEARYGVRSTEGVKIIMTTSVTAVRSVFHAFSELCDGYLFKPIDLEKLRDHIHCLSLPAGR